MLKTLEVLDISKISVMSISYNYSFKSLSELCQSETLFIKIFFKSALGCAT